MRKVLSFNRGKAQRTEKGKKKKRERKAKRKKKGDTKVNQLI